MPLEIFETLICHLLKLLFHIYHSSSIVTLTAVKRRWNDDFTHVRIDLKSLNVYISAILALLLSVQVVLDSWWRNLHISNNVSQIQYLKFN